MASIHGLVFIVIGAVVSLVSQFSDNLRVFTYVGLVFIGYGIIKLFLSRINNPIKKAEDKIIQQFEGAITCNGCSIQLDNRCNFCPKCGMRLQ